MPRTSRGLVLQDFAKGGEDLLDALLASAQRPAALPGVLSAHSAQQGWQSRPPDTGANLTLGCRRLELPSRTRLVLCCRLWQHASHVRGSKFWIRLVSRVCPHRHQLSAALPKQSRSRVEAYAPSSGEKQVSFPPAFHLQIELTSAGALA